VPPARPDRRQRRQHRWQALMRAEDAALNTAGVHKAWQRCLAAIADTTAEREPWVMGGLSCSPMAVA
jgi:hypothetical protein